MCNNLGYVVVRVVQEISFAILSVLILFFVKAVVLARNQKFLIYLQCQPLYYFYYCKQDDLEEQNEMICRISIKQYPESFYFESQL